MEGRGFVANQDTGLLDLDGIAYPTEEAAYERMAEYLINRRGVNLKRSHEEYVDLRDRLAAQLRRTDTRRR